MKFTVLRESLLDVLQKSSNFISSKINDPGVLKLGLFEINEKEISLKTTNIQEFFVGKLGGKIEGEGSFLVDVKTFLEVVKTISDGKILVEKNNQVLIVHTGGGDLRLQTTTLDGFPEPLPLNDPQPINPKVFTTELLSSVLFSLAAEETRPTLTGLCFDIQKNQTRVVATDGFRMSVLNLPTPFFIKKNEEERKIIVPGKGVGSVLKITKNKVAEAGFLEKNNQLFFRADRELVYLRTIEGEYPPYEKVIPSDYETRAVFKKEELLSTLKTASLFIRDGANIVTLLVEEGEIKIKTAASGVGEASLRVGLLEKEGKNNKITFNHRFLSEYLTHTEDVELELSFVGPFSPGVFKNPKSQSNALHIIMPVRT